MSQNQIDELLNGQDPFIIDGGLSNVLEGLGCDLNHKLWTAILLDKNPETIISAHLEYLKSGAQCITTASYQASIPGLIASGYEKNVAELLLIKAVQLAEIAIQRALNSGMIDTKPLIAASIGPYGAFLADGSEYRGNYGVSNQELTDFHSERIEILDGSSADILAFETIPSYQEAVVLSDLLLHTHKPAWVSFSCKNARYIHDGSEINDCISLYVSHPGVFAIGVNCTNPNYISAILKRIQGKTGDKKIIIYPNSGEVYNPVTKTWRWTSAPEHFVDLSKEWIHLGAQIIGGCCRIGPGHIQSLHDIVLHSNRKK